MWTGIGIGIGVLVAILVLGYVFLWDKRTLQQRMEQEDGPDPLKRWVRCVYSLVQFHDLGATSESTARTLLRRDWDCDSRQALDALLADRFVIASGDEAWDLVRAVLLIRLGTAAGFFSHQEGVEKLTHAKQILQQKFDTWEAIGEAYADARLAWQRATGQIDPDDDKPFDSVRYCAKQLRTELWPHVAFRS